MTPPTAPKTRPPRGRTAAGLASAGLTAVLCALHGWATWLALEGRAGLLNGWPLWRDDHPLYFHYGLVARAFLRRSWTTAGYDPAFMSGYAKSVIFPASSTPVELFMAAWVGGRPDVAYKVYVLLGVASIPWLVWGAAAAWRLGPWGSPVAVALYLLYVWTDFPINYAVFGMVPYLLAVPLGLAATGAFVRYVDAGGLRRWFTAALLMSAGELVHPTFAMFVVPAAGLAYLAKLARRKGRVRFSRGRHAGVWLLPVVVVTGNAFWLLPGLWLASTKGPSEFAFTHPEGVLVRLRQIVTTEPPVERLLCAGGVLAVLPLLRRSRAASAALVGFVGAGFFWGYLAGGFRSLDFLQPGRHTYAFYSGLAVAGGLVVGRWLAWARRVTRARFDVTLAVAALVPLEWYFGPLLAGSVRARVLGRVPFLSSRPSARLLWVVDRVGRHVAPGERLLYEEGGFAVPGVPDPFAGGRFSGLLPWKCPGIELIGGPYLHAANKANFTQFGEGKLFERADWGRDWFLKYARLYRPSAILCWTPRARAFCRENPDLIEVKDDDGALLIGRVKGFGGAAVEGRAEVEARPGVLRVSRAEPGVDGSVVLRYHSVPYLRADPPVAWERVSLEGDPVPFIKLRPPPGPTSFEIRFPPPWSWLWPWWRGDERGKTAGPPP